MRLDLGIAGMGAVTPAGVGVAPLLEGKAATAEIRELGRDESWPVLRVDLQAPAFQRWQREPRLRRASPLTYFLIEAADQALGAATKEERAQTGLIIAYSAGCLVYSRRFFEGIVRQGQRTASPALFPETVFNSPMSHVATVLGLNGAAYALVGDESAWTSALITAAVWLQERRVSQVLVLGAEEFDPLVLDAYRSARWLRRGKSAPGFLTSEGAAGLLLRRNPSDNSPRIVTVEDGWIYRTKAEAARMAREMMANSDPCLPVFSTAQRNWLAEIETRALQGRPPVPIFPYLGEAFTASAAWSTIRATTRLNPTCPKLQLPIWGLNHQFGSLELAI